MRYASSAGCQRRLTRSRETTNDSSVAQSRVRVGAKSCRRSTSVGCLIPISSSTIPPIPKLPQIPPNNDSPDMVKSDCVTQNLAQCSTRLTQGSEIVPLSPVPSVMLNETQPNETQQQLSVKTNPSTTTLHPAMRRYLDNTEAASSRQRGNGCSGGRVAEQARSSNCSPTLLLLRPLQAPVTHKSLQTRSKAQ